MTDEYTLTRVDLGGLRSIAIRFGTDGTYEVLADHSVPDWEVDAYVRAALIQEQTSRRQAEPGDPAASA
ncbi:hypothetical protein CFP71_21210 [Amycolatopsis thailandensis]|uniref:Uncharacterized protein n=1 Tax=Amycolatopsis thailandensis TaxID=589330 RepID=A0A229S475_9PSEU|nr:hypothetical protein [Amycolatopsis thailandensis]OXM53733.1 hypothetical protein CFP71_21210 [Amycolatopsis thailandensis]